MSKENKHALSKVEGLIPEIRFPEFLNKEDWKVKTIDELCDILNNIRKPISSGDRKKGSYPYYGASGIIDYVDDFLFDERLLLIGEDGAKWGAYENTAFLVEGRFWVNNHAHVLKPKLINDKLLESYLVKLDLHPYITGAAPPKLTLGKLKEIPVPVPKNEIEQQKIASCLLSLDEVIAAHSQKLELLKDHKKGLMQNLFPKEGEKVPKYRFKEFEKDGEWEEKKLGEVGDIVTGSTPNTSELSNYGGEKLFVSPVDININRYVENTKTKLSELGFSKTRQIPANSVLFVCIGSTIGKVAQNKFVCATNQQINSVIPSNQCSSDFLYSALEKSASIISELAGIQAVPIINKSQFSEVILLFPPTIQEQQKIASCLSSLDALITAQAEKVEQLKLHKKGLMQGLFPKIND